MQDTSCCTKIVRIDHNYPHWKTIQLLINFKMDQTIDPCFAMTNDILTNNTFHHELKPCYFLLCALLIPYVTHTWTSFIIPCVMSCKQNCDETQGNACWSKQHPVWPLIFFILIHSLLVFIYDKHFFLLLYEKRKKKLVIL
jgi:hypothetical protein